MSCKGCKDEVFYTCGPRLNARCVDYEGILSECSNLGSCNKYRLHDVIEDMQGILTDHCKVIGIEDVNTSCLDTPVTFDSFGEYVTDLYSRICTIYSELPDTLCDMDITCLNLDYKCLLDGPCNEGAPNSASELFQLLIDQICEIKDFLSEAMG